MTDVYLSLHFSRGGAFGPVTSAVLQSIIEDGSMVAAAKNTDLDYLKVRKMVKGLNRNFGQIVKTTRGRSGGAYLTSKGRELLDLYIRIERDFCRVFATDLRYLERLVSATSNVDYRTAHMGKLGKEKSSSFLKVPVWTFLVLTFPKPASIGPFRSALLQSIAKYGSISAAAEAIGQDRPKVWRIVQMMNREFGDIIISERGRYGGAHLTSKASKLLGRYLKIESEFRQVFAKDLRYMERLVGGNPDAAPRIPRWARSEEPRRETRIS